jgi:hypothetical protein
MHLRRLFQVLVLGGGALVASACGGADSAVRPSPGGQTQLLPDGGVVTPSPMPGGGGSSGGDGTMGGGGMGGPPGW